MQRHVETDVVETGPVETGPVETGPVETGRFSWYWGPSPCRCPRGVASSEASDCESSSQNRGLKIQAERTALDYTCHQHLSPTPVTNTCHQHLSLSSVINTSHDQHNYVITNTCHQGPSQSPVCNSKTGRWLAKTGNTIDKTGGPRGRHLAATLINIFQVSGSNYRLSLAQHAVNLNLNASVFITNVAHITNLNWL